MCLRRLTLILLFLFAAGMALASPYLRRVRHQQQIARSSVCQHHLAFLYRALDAYHQEHGTFPPAYVAGPDGKPWHSWRILVLETLGEPLSTEVYRQYRFDEPWNGPNNIRLTHRMPEFFACPNAESGPDGHKSFSNYVVLVGPDAVFRGATSLSRERVAALQANTIVLAETLPGVPWLEPRDLDTVTMSFEVDGPLGSSIGSRDPTGAGVVLLDGRVERLKSGVEPTRLRAMIDVGLRSE